MAYVIPTDVEIMVFMAGTNTPVKGRLLAELLADHREEWEGTLDTMACATCGKELPTGFVHYLSCDSGQLLAIWH